MSEVKTWETICGADELDQNLGLRALFGNEQVAVFKVAGKLYAVNAIDPFSKAAVISRGIVGSLQDQTVVASPLYKQHFNLETGQCLEDGEVSLKVYPVRDEGGQVQLGIL